MHNLKVPRRFSAAFLYPKFVYVKPRMASKGQKKYAKLLSLYSHRHVQKPMHNLAFKIFDFNKLLSMLIVSLIEDFNKPSFF